MLLPGSGRQRRLALVFALLASLFVPLAPASVAPAAEAPLLRAAGQGDGAASEAEPAVVARLEARQSAVQWSPALASEWRDVPERVNVQAGDRIRTDGAGSARLTYTQAARTDLGTSTGVLVQHLEGGAGSLRAALFQPGGSVVHRVAADGGVRVEVETPAAYAATSAGSLRADVAPDGTTRLANLAEGLGGVVEVRGLDPVGAAVTLFPGQETEIVPGLPPSPPLALGTLPPLPRPSDAELAARAAQQAQALAAAQAAWAQTHARALAAAQAAQAGRGQPPVPVAGGAPGPPPVPRGTAVPLPATLPFSPPALGGPGGATAPAVGGAAPAGAETAAPRLGAAQGSPVADLGPASPASGRPAAGVIETANEAIPAMAAPYDSPLRAQAPPDAARKKPYLRQEYFFHQRAYPYGQVPDRALLRARQQADQAIRRGALDVVPQGRRAVADSVETPWTPIGPQPIGAGIAGFAVGPLPNSGRVAALAVVDASIAYAGSASGGVWKTTNGGGSWTPLTDNQPSLAIGALALDPTNPNVVYAGLGEQSFASNTSYYGYGVLKSTNAGASWALLPSGCSVDESCPFSRQTVGRVAVDPSNAQIVYAATDGNGIARSNNGGATWTTTYPCADLSCAGAITDVLIDGTTSPSTVFVAVGNIFGAPGNAVYRTTTGQPHAGASWTRLPGTAGASLPTADIGRIRLTITRTSPPTIYAVAQKVSTSGILGVWKSADRGATWNLTTHPDATTGVNSQNTWYNLNVAVFPTDANVVYVLAQELLKSTNGGASWTNASQTQGPPFKVHIDQHAFDFVPGNANAFYLGNDGGVYRSTDGGNTFANLNAGLATVQFFRGAAHPTDPGVAFGGTQDNGSLSYQGAPSWFRSNGGDGGYAAFDYNNPNVVYSTLQQLVIDKSTTGPRGTFLAADRGIPPPSVEPRQFIAPLVMDPTNPLVLYAGTTRLYRTANGAGTWAPISPVLASSSDPFAAISAIGVARSAPTTLYVGTGSGGLPGRLWVTTNGGGTWTDRTAGLPDRSITAVAVHPTNASLAYVTLSGFGAGHVWKTANAGATWTDVSAGLPDAPVNAVVIDPNDGEIVYVGTDVGVFKTSVGGAAWGMLNAGLPNAVVTDVVLNRAGTRLFAFTHGRGVFASDRTVIAATPTPVLSPTPTPPPATCDPRPTVTVAVAPGAPGALQVTVAASAAANAFVQSLQFGAATGALIDVPGQPPGQSGSFAVTLPAGTRQTTFTVRRAAAGQAATVPLTVHDSCGPWPTFVGGGAGAF